VTVAPPPSTTWRTKLAELKSALSLKRRFNVEVAWNLVSFGILAVAGVLMNVLVVRTRGESGLGVFNQVFAFYIMLSQVAVLGIHFSALMHVSQSQGDRARCADIATAAVLLVTLLGVAVAAVTFALRDVVADVWGSPGVGVGLGLIAPGLVGFALNKVLLNVLNGLRYMRAYAVFQALRILLIVGAIVGLIAAGQPAEMLAAALTLGELSLLVCLGVYMQGWVLPLSLSRRLGAWFRAHARYGLRGFLSGALAEINTRVDVLMLGVLCTDAVVGVYSFAAMLAEGFSQIAMVIRRVVDPILGARFAAGESDQIPGYAAKIRRLAYPLMGVVTLLAVGLYPAALALVAPGDGLAASWLVFAILMGGVFINAGYRPFLGVLLQGGRPGTHTILISVLVLSNVVLNALLIPALQIYGAAVATGCVFALEAVLIVVFARRVLGIRL
jgi:O-antigen/teichoic acid export membrane protein